jgi:PAS domain S-box-containing protein
LSDQDGESVRRDESDYRDFFNEMPAGCMLFETVVDEEGLVVNLRLLEANRAFERHTGTSSAAVTGKTLKELMPSISSERLGAIGEVALKGTSLVYDDHIPEYARWCEVQAFCPQHGRVAVLFQDITQRKSDELLLKASEEKFHKIFESSPNAITIATLEEGRYLDVNDGFTRMFGFDRTEVIGRTSLEVGIWRDSADRAEKVATLRAHHRMRDVEIIYLRKDGSTVIGLESSDLVDLDGITCVLSTLQDVTDRKRMEEQLLRAQRLEAAGRIAGQVAHDFNNLLGPMTAYPELIKMRLPAGHSAASFCDAMLDAAQQMADINEDMMALARRGHFQQETVDLNGLVSQVVRQMGDRTGGIDVRLDFGSDVMLTIGSRSQLSRIVLNLLSNAIDAMHGSGTLTITTRNRYIDSPIGQYNRVEVGEYVEVAVSDTGSGIAEEIRDRIFDAFFTTKTTEKRRGCGLGLSVVQTIVEDHMGYIDLETVVGRGTTFRVYLPVHREATNGAEVRASLVGGSERVLVVDDDPSQREVVKTMLSTLGYGVETAASGDEAVAFLRSHSVELVMLDMVMPPGMDGLSTYRQILMLRPDQRAIVMSGFALSDRMEAMQGLGAGAFLRKPLTIGKLAQAVRLELDRKS